MSSETDHEQLPGEIEEGKNKTVHYISDAIHQQDVQKDADYINDDLFPEGDRTEQAAAAGQTKKVDDDYYVNDDLFPKSTTAQAAHSSHSDEGLASAA